LFLTFVLTGFREQEVVHLSWDDINSSLNTIKVTAKGDLGFYPKRWEDWEVPVAFLTPVSFITTSIAGAFHPIVNKSSSVDEIALGTNTKARVGFVRIQLHVELTYSRWNLAEKLMPMGKSFGIVGLRTNIS
jgi:hypothetical protein